MKLREMIEGQGGDPAVTDDPDGVMGTASFKKELVSENEGYVNYIHGTIVGMASMTAGAGRKMLDDEIDLLAGITLNKKVGDHVEVGETLCTVWSGDERKLSEALETVREAFVIDSAEPENNPLILDIVTSDMQ